MDVLTILMNLMKLHPTDLLIHCLVNGLGNWRKKLDSNEYVRVLYDYYIIKNSTTVRFVSRKLNLKVYHIIFV